LRSADGNKYVLSSNENLEIMQNLIKAESPNSQICDSGRNTRIGAFLAAVAYKESRDNFLIAINQCEAPNDAIAAKNADIATEAYNRNAELIAKFDNMLSAQCNFKPLTPLLPED
jgi:hypothetical protein